MEVVIIADDLTGANDSGVQFARRGLSTSVLFQMDKQAVHDQECIVLNTDSRSSPSRQAYERVAEAASFLQTLSARWIYKKMDSALRGNIGQELDAMYAVFQPDFLIIAPAYPDNGRTTVDGVHYVNGIPVHLTELAADQKTPVTESYIPALLAEQTTQQVAVLTYTELRADKAVVISRLQQFHAEGFPYIVSDVEHEADLVALVQAVVESGYRVVWAGSAGLAKHLPINPAKLSPPPHFEVESRSLPVLVAVGSLNSRSYKQLQRLLASNSTTGIEMQSELLVTSLAEQAKEIRRVNELAVAAVRSGRDVVIHVSMDEGAVERTLTAAKSSGKPMITISESIAAALGQAVSEIVAAEAWAGIVMTGGDTATHICNKLGIKRFELIDEDEPGVPKGILVGETRLLAVTKAGSFGSDEVLLQAIARIKECSHS